MLLDKDIYFFSIVFSLPMFICIPRYSAKWALLSERAVVQAGVEKAAKDFTQTQALPLSFLSVILVPEELGGGKQEALKERPSHCQGAVLTPHPIP